MISRRRFFWLALGIFATFTVTIGIYVWDSYDYPLPGMLIDDKSKKGGKNWLPLQIRRNTKEFRQNLRFAKVSRATKGLVGKEPINTQRKLFWKVYPRKKQYTTLDPASVISQGSAIFYPDGRVEFSNRILGLDTELGMDATFSRPDPLNGIQIEWPEKTIKLWVGVDGSKQRPEFHLWSDNQGTILSFYRDK